MSETGFDIAQKMSPDELNDLMNDKYIFGNYTLDENNNPIPCSINEWVALYRDNNGINRRYVGLNNIGNKQISTVFVGIDMEFEHTPVLFQTIIFGKDNQYNTFCRYRTWKEAEEGHKKAIEYVNNGSKDEEE